MLNFIKNLLSRPRHAAKTRQYRIVRFGAGWEPQFSYTAGLVPGTFWYALNEDGYWLDPDAFSTGGSEKRISLPKKAAERAILRARAINQEHISAA